MTDQYSLCLDALKTQLRTLTAFFPAVTGMAAGWQVSENDLTPMEGSDHFVVLRPGAFSQTRRSDMLENEWHTLATLYMRYAEYDNLWPLYRAFRAAVLELPDTKPIRTNGIWYQAMAAQGEPGYIVDAKTGAYLNLVAQTLDVTIKQRVKIR